MLSEPPIIKDYADTKKSLIEAQVSVSNQIAADLIDISSRIQGHARIAHLQTHAQHHDRGTTYAAMVVYEVGVVFDSVELAEAPGTMYGEEVAQAINDSARLIAGEIDTGLRALADALATIAKHAPQISASITSIASNGVTAWKVDGERPPTE
jgi:hypothetical protein